MSNFAVRVEPATAPSCCPPLCCEPLDATDAVTMAAAFKALADPIRLRLFSLIASHPGGEACVCDLTGPFEVSQPTISHHLRTLREAGLVESDRRGTWVYYRARTDTLARLATLLGPAATPAETPA